MFPSGLFMVHNATTGCQDKVTENNKHTIVNIFVSTRLSLQTNNPYEFLTTNK